MPCADRAVRVVLRFRTWRGACGGSRPTPWSPCRWSATARSGRNATGSACRSSARCACARCRKIVTDAIVMCVGTSVNSTTCHQVRLTRPLASQSTRAVPQRHQFIHRDLQTVDIDGASIVGDGLRTQLPRIDRAFASVARLVPSSRRLLPKTQMPLPDRREEAVGAVAVRPQAQVVAADQRVGLVRPARVAARRPPAARRSSRACSAVKACAIVLVLGIAAGCRWRRRAGRPA